MGLPMQDESDRGYPTHQKALVCGPNAEFNLEPAYPTIDCEPECVIIKVAALPLNPVDTKMLGGFAVPGNIHGNDTAGTIVAVGSKITQDLKVGDRVAGSAEIMNKDRPLGGAFAEYVSLHSSLVLKLPDALSFEEAAAFGTPIASTVVTLFHSLGLPTQLLEKPAEKSFPILVYGGSTATGTMLMQFLNIMGLEVVTTCSPRNFDLVKSYGATEAFDYNDPDCAANIKAYTKNTLGYAIDCITSASSMKICYGAIGRVGGKYTALDPYPEAGATRKVVKADWILAMIIRGNNVYWPEPFGRPANQWLLDVWVPPLYKVVQKLLDDGKFRAHPVQVMEGGFEGLIDGVGKVRRGEVQACKLVYPI